MEEKEVGYLCVKDIIHNWEGFIDCDHFQVTMMVK